MSAVFFGVFLCVVGVVDQGCGRHGNFSSIIQHVIDNNQTWRESYPLGSAIFENGSYPLTVGSVMDGCRRNQSLFTVLQLQHRYNIDDIINIPESEGVSESVLYMYSDLNENSLLDQLFLRIAINRRVFDSIQCLSYG